MEKIDQEWFEQYTKHCFFDDTDYLKVEPDTLAKEKERFLNGEIDTPFLTYNIPTHEIIDKKESLLSLQDKVYRSDKPKLISRAYIRKIKEQLLKIHLIEKTIEKDDNSFFDISKKLYGITNQDDVSKAEELLNKTYPKDSNDELLDAAYIKQYMNNVLLEKDISGDWSAEIAPNKLVVSVSYKDKRIYIPKKRKVTLTQLQALAEHEIGIHVVRYLNGLRSPLLLLSSGLDHYLQTEEGLASKTQSEIDGKFPSVGTYIAISYITSPASTRKTFREIYDFMYNYRKHMYNIEDEGTLQEQAWTRTIRLFRGTTGQTPGVCFTRDSSYFSGYLKVKKLFEKEDPELTRVLQGKYDPTNKEHIELLDYLEM